MFSENYGKKTISVGPWGGQDGFHWDDGVHTTVRQIEIAHGAGIDSVRIEYDLNGASVRLEKHGGSGGAKTDKVNLKYPEEFLTSIHGYYGSLQEWGPVFVRSLTFDSNKRRYGPYGIEEGTPFSIPNAGAKVVGFHGKCGWYLDAIGAYIQPLHQPVPSNSMIHSGNYFAHGREKYEYALIHGNLGQNYDLVVTLRQRDNFYNNGSAPIGSVSRQSSNSRELGHMETMNKISSVPPQIERVPSKTVTGVVTYGPWGGAGGTVFDDGIYDGIRQINLSRNVRIVSIRVCYEQNGQPIWGTKNGGTGGFKTDKIIFDYPSEILTHITGYYGPTMIMGPNIIKSLTFHTTNTKHGPFGVEQGQSFSTDLKQGMILGFHGRKGLFLDAIGVHVVEGKVESKLVSHSNSFNRQDSSSSEGDDSKRFLKIGKKGLMEQAVQRVVQGPSPCGPGPWGGDGGKPWDDGVFTGIKQIILTRKTEAICSIEIEYDRNGQSVWSVKHGGNAGETPIRVKLEYPHEVVTCISGHYGPLNKSGEGTNVIKSLTFHTSRRKCGPFGDEVGTFFTSTTTEGKVVGFHGRSGFYLDAIGVHMQHWFGNQRKPSSFMKFFS